MKSAGWYFMNGTRKVIRDTKAEITKLAQAFADRTGVAVTVRPLPKARPAAKPAARKRVMKRNPDPGSYLDVWRERDTALQDRRAYMKRTKGQRIAKESRSRGSRTASHEAAAKKTGKFAVDAKRGREEFTLYRPSRHAAEALADQFLAAGYKVKVSPA